jgi:hypothetical protein
LRKCACIPRSGHAHTMPSCCQAAHKVAVVVLANFSASRPTSNPQYTSCSPFLCNPSRPPVVLGAAAAASSRCTNSSATASTCHALNCSCGQGRWRRRLGLLPPISGRYPSPRPHYGVPSDSREDPQHHLAERPTCHPCLARRGDLACGL